MRQDLEKKIALLADQPQLSFLSEAANLLPDAEWFVVGGAVRDAVLGRLSERHDFDLLVRGVGLKEVTKVLERLGTVDLVGRDFGVLKFVSSGAVAGETAIDIAWPRTERAGGSGARRDFKVDFDPSLRVEDDLARRDFTVNAMAWSLAEDRLIDPFAGLADLEAKLIRSVGEPEQRFAEDYSRLLRAVRFACELGFEIEARTWRAIKDLSPHIDDLRIEGKVSERVVPYETVASEFLKALVADPLRAVDLLEQSGLLFHLLPELERLPLVDQPPEWHSEGDVWQHTKLALQQAMSPEFVTRFGAEKVAAEVLVAVLLHDIGKAETKKEIASRITFHGHDEVGAKLARAAVERLRLSSAAQFGISAERIEWLVHQHMFPLLADLDHVRKTTLARIFLKDETLGQHLLELSFCDLMASIPSEGQPDPTNLNRIRDELIALKAKQQQEPEMFLSGDEVMTETGLASGPKIGRLLDELHEAQLSGEITTKEQALELLRKKFSEIE